MILGTAENPQLNPPCLDSEELREVILSSLTAGTNDFTRTLLAASLASGPAARRAAAAETYALRGESAPLLPYSKDRDATVARFVLDALGSIGDRAALAALSGPQPPSREPARRLALVACLGAFARRGEAAAAVPAARALYADPAAEPAVRTAAARILLAADPAFFAEGTRNPSPLVRRAVISAADAVPTAELAAYGRALNPSNSAPEELQLLVQLSRRREPAAAQAAAEALGSVSPEIVKAALETLVKIGTVRELPAVLPLLARRDAAGAAARSALGNYRAAGAGRALLGWASNDCARLCLVLPILAERQEAALLPAIGALTASPDASVRKAAWKSLAKQATAERLAPYAAWFRQAGHPEIFLAAGALRITMKNADPMIRQATLATTWAQSAELPRQALAPLMASFPSPDDLPLFAEALQTGGTDLREAVLRAAGDWNSFGIYPLLLRTAENEGDPSLRRTAFRSALKIMTAFGGAGRKGGYVTLFKLAPSEAMRLQAADALYDLEWVQAFDTLAALAANDPASAAAAKSAYAALADRVLKNRGASDLREIDWHHWGLSSFRNDTDVWLTNDRNLASRWDSGVFSKKGMWFAIDINHPVYLRKIVLDTDRSPVDTPNGLDVFVSPDGKAWSGPVASVDGHSTCQTVIPLAVRTRWAKLVTTGGREKAYWSIHELYLYEGIDDAAAESIRRQAEAFQTKPGR